MLGKLIKYEMKSQGFMYAGIYIVVMILSIVTFGAYKINTAMGGNPVFSTIYRFAIAGAVIALIAMFIITLVMSILRYRNNLLKDEGYLMHTLPVSAASLHFSKMIASIIWFAADFIVLMLSIGFITGDLKYSWIKKLKMFMSAETDGTATGMVISGITGTVVAITVLYIIKITDIMPAIIKAPFTKSIVAASDCGICITSIKLPPYIIIQRITSPISERICPTK